MVCSRCGGEGVADLELVTCDPSRWIHAACPRCHGSGEVPGEDDEPEEPECEEE